MRNPLSVAVALALTVAPLSVANAASPVSRSASHAATRLRVLVPEYGYPSKGNQDWPELAKLAKADPGLLAVIVNVDNGPGARVDPTYKAAVGKLRAAGAQLLGYDQTSYGKRPVAVIERDMRRWSSLYGVTSFFLDEAPSEPGHEAEFEKLYHYDKSRFGIGSTVVTNPGDRPSPSYLYDDGQPLTDVAVSYENSPTRDQFTKPFSAAQLHGRQIGAIAYAVSAKRMADEIKLMVSRGASWIYVTDGHEPNPYAHLPAYFAHEAQDVRRGD